MMHLDRVPALIVASLPINHGARLILVRQGQLYASVYQDSAGGLTTIDHYPTIRAGRDAVTAMWANQTAEGSK